MARLRLKVEGRAVMPWWCVLLGHDWMVAASYARCGRAGCSFEALR